MTTHQWDGHHDVILMCEFFRKHNGGDLGGEDGQWLKTDLSLRTFTQAPCD